MMNGNEEFGRTIIAQSFSFTPPNLLIHLHPLLTLVLLPPFASLFIVSQPPSRFQGSSDLLEMQLHHGLLQLRTAAEPTEGLLVDAGEREHLHKLCEQSAQKHVPLS